MLSTCQADGWRETNHRHDRPSCSPNLVWGGEWGGGAESCRLRFKRLMVPRNRNEWEDEWRQHKHERSRIHKLKGDRTDSQRGLTFVYRGICTSTKTDRTEKQNLSYVSRRITPKDLQFTLMCVWVCVWIFTSVKSQILAEKKCLKASALLYLHFERLFSLVPNTFECFSGGGRSHLEVVNSIWPRLIGCGPNSPHLLPRRRNERRGGGKNSVIKPWVMSGSHGWHPPLFRFSSLCFSNLFHSVFSSSLPWCFSLPLYSPFSPSLNPSSHFSFTPLLLCLLLFPPPPFSHTSSFCLLSVSFL